MNNWLLALMTAVGLTASAPALSAGTVVLHGTFSGTVEVPSISVPGTGSAAVTVDDAANSVFVFPGLQSSSVGATIAGLEAGGAYIDILSDGRSSGGEIRANLPVGRVPEPATFALIGLGLTGLALILRRKI
jgi:PEP-CTERM motif